MSDLTINGVRVPFLPAGGADALRERTSPAGSGGSPFEEILSKEADGLKISKHAQERLESRNIQLNETDFEQLQRAVSKAALKGSKDSLVMLRDMAFIVSVQNKTIVTALDTDRMKDGVVTNIDSAIVA
jgi:flagellar operon protein